MTLTYFVTEADKAAYINTEIDRPLPVLTIHDYLLVYTGPGRYVHTFNRQYMSDMARKVFSVFNPVVHENTEQLIIPVTDMVALKREGWTASQQHVPMPGDHMMVGIKAAILVARKETHAIISPLDNPLMGTNITHEKLAQATFAYTMPSHKCWWTIPAWFPTISAAPLNGGYTS